MDFKKCTSLESSTVPFDGLGIFISSHLSCDWSENNEEHLKVFSTLLELGTDPCGHYYKSPGHFCPIFLAALGTCVRQKRIEVLDILWSHAARPSTKADSLFNESKEKVLDMEAFTEETDADVFQWFFDHGAVISTTLARYIGEPLTDHKSLYHQPESPSTYSAAYQTLCHRGITRDALESSLINTWIYELDKHFAAGHRTLLSKRFRNSVYYAPDAQTMAAEFNPDWEIESRVSSYHRDEGTRGRPTHRFWESLFPFGRLN